MFKKLLSFAFILCFTTVSAFANSNKGLKAAFDELNYSLSVEWDQKDQDFYAKQMKKMMDTLGALRAQGLTNAQLVEFVKSEVKDERIARDLDTAYSMISINKMSSEEASQYMIDSMKRSYNTGASWSGNTLLFVGIGLLIVAAAVALSNSGSSSSTPSCTNYVTECGYGEYYCYYDAWGYRWCDLGYTCTDVCY